MRPITGQRGTAAALVAALLTGGLVLAGCAAGHAARKIPHSAAVNQAVAGNRLAASTPVAAGKGTVGAFIAKLQARAVTPFEATYLSFGKVPADIVYAVRPPDGLLFRDNTVVAGKTRHTQIVVNGSGEYRCVQRGTGHAQWTCRQLGRASAAAQNKTFAVYTAAHWAAYLKTVALAAGAKVTTVTQPANTVPMIGRAARDKEMDCLGFRPAGAPAGFAGLRSICAAAPGILGSVFGCSGPGIVLHWYITSPPASLFQLPPGARVIGLKGGQQPRAA
jgi:hypothetical protein